MKALIFSLMILAIGCQDPVTKPNPEPKSNKLNLVWSVRSFPKDSILQYYSDPPQIWKNFVVYYAANDPWNSNVITRSLDSGKLVNIWNDNINRGFGENVRSRIIDDVLFAADQRNLYGINVLNGNHYKYSGSGSKPPRVSTAYNLVFRTINDKHPDTEISSLGVYSPNDLRILNEIKIYRDNTYHPSAEPPIAEISNTGDTLLYFISRDWNSSGQAKVDVFSYNYSADSMVWQSKDITHKGNASVHAPLIAGEHIYIQGAFSVVCLDKTTGTKVWEHIDEYHGFGDCNLLYDSGIVYAKGGLKDFFALDALTGKLLWTIEDDASNSKYMEMYRGKIYLDSSGDGELLCVNPASRKIEWRYGSPNESKYPLAAFQHGIAIDQSTGYLYTTDGYYVMCIDLSKTE